MNDNSLQICISAHYFHMAGVIMLENGRKRSKHAVTFDVCFYVEWSGTTIFA
jgi:hypothetical protein